MTTRLPQLNMRLPADLHAVMRQTARSLRSDPGLADALWELCLADQAPGLSRAIPDSGALDELRGAVRALSARVDALERGTLPDARRDMLDRALDLQAKGWNLRRIMAELDCGLEYRSFKNALSRRRRELASRPGEKIDTAPC